MAEALIDRAQEIAERRGISESEVLRKAFECGVKELWRDHILSRYLNDDISQERAGELVGIDLVMRAEQGAEAIEEDIQ